MEGKSVLRCSVVESRRSEMEAIVAKLGSDYGVVHQRIFDVKQEWWSCKMYLYGSFYLRKEIQEQVLGTWEIVLQLP